MREWLSLMNFSVCEESSLLTTAGCTCEMQWESPLTFSLEIFLSISFICCIHLSNFMHFSVCQLSVRSNSSWDSLWICKNKITDHYITDLHAMNNYYNILLPIHGHGSAAWHPMCSNVMMKCVHGARLICMFACWKSTIRMIIQPFCSELAGIMVIVIHSPEAISIFCGTNL